MTSLAEQAAVLVQQADVRVTELLAEVHRITGNADLLERRRGEIVVAAYREFTARGFRSTSVSAVAQAAGIDKRTLYDYVASKEDLLYLLFLHHLPLQLQRLAGAIVDDGEGADVQLRRLMREHLQYIKDFPELALLSYREMRYLERKQIQNSLWLIEQIMRLYDAVIVHGIAEGILRSPNPRATSHVVRAAVDMPGLAGWDLQRFAGEEVERAVVDAVLHGLLVRDVATTGEQAPASQEDTP